MRYNRIPCTFLFILLLVSCRAPAFAPTETAMPTPTPTSAATPTLEQPMATPSPTALVIQVEPTFTPHPGDERISVRNLAIGQSGNYVNLIFGYWLQYPQPWYTGFGNRPLLVSFSDLDPGTHNRHSMRVEGCLIEVHAMTNIYGFTPQELLAQLPGMFPNADGFELDGEPGMRGRPSTEEEALFESEWVLVGHDDRLFRLTFDYAKGAAEICGPAWENLLATWQWFTPEFAVYRNREYGYAISHPREWYRSNQREEGISVSSQDPTGMTSLAEFLQQAMLIETDVYENLENLPLKEWLAQQDWKVDLTNDIPLDGLIGVRVLRQGPSVEIQEMSGYFEGLFGRIYVVTCLYPAERQWEFRPIANAVIYSFSL